MLSHVHLLGNVCLRLTNEVLGSTVVQGAPCGVHCCSGCSCGVHCCSGCSLWGSRLFVMLPVGVHCHVGCSLWGPLLLRVLHVGSTAMWGAPCTAWGPYSTASFLFQVLFVDHSPAAQKPSLLRVLSSCQRLQSLKLFAFSWEGNRISCIPGWSGTHYQPPMTF